MPPRRERDVVARDDPPRRRCDAERHDRSEADELRRPHKTSGADMRDEASGLRKARRDERDGHERHPRNLGHGHQRNRQKVQREAGERDAREEQRARRKQNNFSRH